MLLIVFSFLSTPSFKFYMDYSFPFSSLFIWPLYFIYSTGVKENFDKIKMGSILLHVL